MPPKLRAVIWGLRILLALAFAGAAGAKLAGVPQLVQLYDTIGFGQWFRYFTAAVEIAGVVLVLVPATAFFGALLLSATMVGAVATHLLIGGSSVPAVVLGVLAGFVAWHLRPALHPEVGGVNAR